MHLQKSNFTPGIAKKLLVKGETTQAQILKTWGSPNIVTQKSNGEAVWTYSKQSFDSKNEASAGSIIIFGRGSASHQTTTSSFDAVITFDAQDIVKDFSLTSTQF